MNYRNKEYIIYFSIFILFSFLYFIPIFKCHGSILNWDSFAHFYLSNFLISGLKHFLVFPFVNIFGGINYFLNFPSLFYYIFAGLYFLLFRIFPINIIWNIYLYLIIISFGVGIFFLFKKLKIHPYFALLVSILITLFRNTQCCSEFGSSNIFGIGILPFSFSFIWIPFYISYTIEILESLESFNNAKAVYQKALLASIFGALIFYSHFYTFLIMEIFIGIYFLLNLNRNNYKRLIKNFIILNVFLLILLSPYLLHYIKDSYQFISNNNIVSAKETIERLKLFFIPGSKESLDFLFPSVIISGFISIVLLFVAVFSKKFFFNHLIFIKLLISFILTTIIFVYFPVFFKIKLPFEFSYAHFYGRFLAFFKYFYLLFAILGLYVLSQLVAKRKIIYLILLGIIGIIVVTNIISSLSYFEINCANLVLDSVSKEFLDISRYLGLKKGGVLISSFVDNYYQKFLVPNLTMVDFYPSIAAWWPSIKNRNYNYYLFDDYQKREQDKIMSWLNDFGINYIVTIKNDDLSWLNFVKLYEGNNLCLWEKKNKTPKIEHVSNLIAVIDDEMYFRNFNSALKLYNNLSTNNIRAIIVPTSNINDVLPLMPFVKVIVIGKVHNCVKIQDFLLNLNKSNNIPLYKLDENSCNLKISNFTPEFLNSNIYNEAQLHYEVVNPWFFSIKSPHIKPILIKTNYDTNWIVLQNDKRLKVFLSLPQNLVIFPTSTQDIVIKYENDQIIICCIIIVIGMMLALSIYLKIKNNHFYEKSKNKDINL